MKGRQRNQRPAANNLSLERSPRKLLEESLFALLEAEALCNYRLAVTECVGVSAVDLADFLGRDLSIGLFHELWVLLLPREPFPRNYSVIYAPPLRRLLSIALDRARLLKSLKILGCL